MRPIDKIRQPITVRPPKTVPITPCAPELSALFSCWRAYSPDAPACAALLTKLVACRTRGAAAQVGTARHGKEKFDRMNLWLGRLSQNGFK